MTTYEIFLLIGALFGALGVISFASVILDRGSIRIFATFTVISCTALYVASRHAENGLDAHDIPPAINKVLKNFMG